MYIATTQSTIDNSVDYFIEAHSLELIVIFCVILHDPFIIQIYLLSFTQIYRASRLGHEHVAHAFSKVNGVE